MIGQSNLMPGQLPGYARVWLRLWQAAFPQRELPWIRDHHGLKVATEDLRIKVKYFKINFPPDILVFKRDSYAKLRFVI